MVPKGHPSGADIASASNDGVIRLWRLDGQQVAELHGHDNFIYSLASLPNGELVSSGEDRTVRVWKGLECIQTITHPALSVWTVAVCRETGDIVSGASDGVIRVFTRSSERLADAQTLGQFDEAVKASSIPEQQMEGFNKEKIPGPEFLTTKSGTKEGQVQMIKENDGSITAHQWSMSKYLRCEVHCRLAVLIPPQANSNGSMSARLSTPRRAAAGRSSIREHRTTTSSMLTSRTASRR